MRPDLISHHLHLFLISLPCYRSRHHQWLAHMILHHSEVSDRLFLCLVSWESAGSSSSESSLRVKSPRVIPSITEEWEMADNCYARFCYSWWENSEVHSAVSQKPPGHGAQMLVIVIHPFILSGFPAFPISGHHSRSVSWDRLNPK